jgi:hypothetical protein
MIDSGRLRRIVRYAAASIALCLGLFTAAGAAQAQTGAPSTSHAAQIAAAATTHQNAVVDEVMAQRPEGTRVSASEVKWSDGTLLTVSAEPETTCPDQYYCGCPAGYFCAWPAAFSGSWVALPNATLQKGPYFEAWGQCSKPAQPGCNAGIHSWASNTGFRTWLEQDPNSGNELCISNRTSNLAYNGVDADDYWIYLSSNSAVC